jgi:hypothetical protein
MKPFNEPAVNPPRGVIISASVAELSSERGVGMSVPVDHTDESRIPAVARDKTINNRTTRYFAIITA